jgi:hypothetical protein
MSNFSGQIENRNFLSSTNFKFTLNRSPKVAFFSNQASIPSLTLGVANQPNYLTDIPVPGDKMIFDDFTIRFLVDENLENYMEIQNWMRGLGFPESLQEIYDWQSTNKSFEQPYKSDMNLYSDATLICLNSNQRFNFQIKFKSMFPVFLSSLDFDSTVTETEYFTADVTFKYMMYNILDKRGNPLNPPEK